MELFVHCREFPVRVSAVRSPIVVVLYRSKLILPARHPLPPRPGAGSRCETELPVTSSRHHSLVSVPETLIMEHLYLVHSLSSLPVPFRLEVLGWDDGGSPFGVWVRQARWSARSKAGGDARSCHDESVARYDVSGCCSDLRVLCFSMSSQWRGREVST